MREEDYDILALFCVIGSSISLGIAVGNAYESTYIGVMFGCGWSLFLIMLRMMARGFNKKP